MARSCSRSWTLFVLSAFLLLSTYSLTVTANDLCNENVRRTVDLSTHLAKITADVLLSNDGGGGSAAQSFTWSVEPDLAPHLAYIAAWAWDDAEDDYYGPLDLAPTTLHGQRGLFYEVRLPVAVEAGAKLRVKVETVFSHVLKPLPTHIAQAERQLVLFRGNHYLYSPYLTRRQTTHVRLASKAAESYTELGDPVKYDEAIEYGPFRDVAPFSEDVMEVHYENNTPFLAVTGMTRTVEVSHWGGNVAVEDSIELRHTGAVLKGSFSRFDYQARPDSGAAAVNAFRAVLPAAARDVYYRDEIGNISTSRLRALANSVHVHLKPRFPLFGGWRTDYVIGYSLPSHEHLLYDPRDDRYALKVKLVDHVFNDQVIDSLTVKIVLPEGAGNIRVDAPYPIDRMPDQLHYAYLDTFGRPVVVVNKTNVVEQHIQDVVVHYTFNKLWMLQEPLLLTGAFYVLFIAVIIYRSVVAQRPSVPSSGRSGGSGGEPVQIVARQQGPQGRGTQSGR